MKRVTPLYGKEVGVEGSLQLLHDYWGDNHSIPIKDSQNRDCMDDVGCQELYGSESVTSRKTFQCEYVRVDNFM